MKPLLYLDAETTGLNPATDAIVSLALHCSDGGDTYNRDWIFKPWKPIPLEVEQLTGITNEMVQHCPPFQSAAAEIHNALSKCDLAGFNLRHFDIPILWEELNRCAIEWNLDDTLVIDAGVIFKKKEARTLSAAMQFYCGKPHEGAHCALADCRATRQVLEAQLNRYPDLAALDRAALAKASEYDGPRPLTFDGKIIEGPDGDAIYNFGQNTKGVKVRDDINFAYWILSKDFPVQTKTALRKLLDHYEQEIQDRIDKANDKADDLF